VLDREQDGFHQQAVEISLVAVRELSLLFKKYTRL
jgi:hypothetical protein